MTVSQSSTKVCPVTRKGLIKTSGISSLLSGALLLTGLLAFNPNALAANGTWSGATDNNWATGGNWAGGVPGATGTTNNGDTATFTGSPTNKSPIVDAGRNLKNIIFDGATGQFNTGTMSGNALLLSDSGTISLNSNTTISQNLKAPLILEGTSYTINDDSASNSVALKIGDSAVTTASGTAISGVAGDVVLTLSGNHVSGTSQDTQSRINGAIVNGSANSLSILKTGAGTWTLQGTSNYTGSTVIREGALRIANILAVSGNTAPIQLGDASTSNSDVAFFDAATGNTFTRSITVNGTGSGKAIIGVDSAIGGAVTFATGTISLNRNVILQGGSTTNSTIFNGLITGNGNIEISSIAATQGGRVSLGNINNNFVGNVTVDANAALLLANGSGSGAGVITDTANVQVDGSMYVNNRATDANQGEIINALSGTGTIQTSTNVNKILTVGSAGGSGSYSGIIRNTDGVTGTGTMSFVKVGSGTQTLSGNNTYSGTTFVSAGTLLVNGAHAGAGAYTVAGTLGGSGSITTAGNAGVTLNAGAHLSPGGALSPGALTMDLGSGSLNLSAALAATNSQALQFTLNGIGSSDEIILSNAASLLNIGTGSLEFDDFAFTTGGGFGAGVYTLFDTSNSIVGSLGANLTGTIGGFNGTLSLANGGQDIVLTVSAIPEPGTVALLVAGLGLIAFIRRHRRVAA